MPELAEYDSILQEIASTDVVRFGLPIGLSGGILKLKQHTQYSMADIEKHYQIQDTTSVSTVFVPDAFCNQSTAECIDLSHRVEPAITSTEVIFTQATAIWRSQVTPIPSA
jgi:hypothetical protein